jgi:hypothetical protein
MVFLQLQQTQAGTTAYRTNYLAGHGPPPEIVCWGIKQPVTLNAWVGDPFRWGTATATGGIEVSSGESAPFGPTTVRIL